MQTANEAKNKRIGLIVTIGLHASLLILFLFVNAWSPPDPPIPEYGIELNFGMVKSSSGDTQPREPVKQVEKVESAKPEPVAKSPEPAPEPVEEAVEPTEEVTEQVTEPVESPSPDYQEKQAEESKPDPVEQPEEVKVKPVAQKDDIEKVSDGGDGKDGDEAKPEDASHGDKEEANGDQGDEKGTIDSRALMGNPGSSDGSSLELTGWTWDFTPKVNDNSQESGKIVFEIKIDADGYIISVRPIESTVSKDVEQKYRKAVEQLSFSPTYENTMPAPTSTGKITFIIKAR